MRSPAAPLRRLGQALAALLALAPLLGLGQTETSRPPTLPWRDPADPALAAHVEQAKASLQLLVSTLSDSAAAAVQDGGPHQGVVTCQLQALPLTQQSALASPPRITALKRTSLRVRNPANAPDVAEQAALDRVAGLLATGAPLPPLLVQELTPSATQPAELRIYKPLTLAAQCLACHGDPSTLDPALRDALALRYPNDAATGYAEGDWRGLIRVSLTP